MIDVNDVNAKAEVLSDLLGQKLGVRGSTFAARLSKAGRSLPRRLRASGQIIVAAQAKAAHPKLARLEAEAPVEAAFDELSRHLRGINASERRKTQVLRWLGGLVFNLILMTVLVVLLLRWQGVL